MESADSITSMDNTSINSVSAARAEKSQNSLQVIYSTDSQYSQNIYTISLSDTVDMHFGYMNFLD